MRIILCGFMIRLLFAYYNVNIDTLYGANYDALAFHEFAVNYSNTLEYDEKKSNWYYAYFLGYFYYIVGPYLTLGCFLSCFVWFLSAITLYFIIKTLKFTEVSQIVVLLLYSFLPSSLVYTSITLRETYQILFINFSFLFILFFYISNKKFYFLFFLVSIILLSFFHRGLTLFSLFLFVFTIFYLSSYKMKILLVPISIFLALLFYYFFKEIFNIDLSVGFYKTVEGYLRGHFESRTLYMAKPIIENFYDFLIFFPESIFKYFFYPMPWQIENILDFILLIENSLRLILFIFIGKNIYLLGHNNKFFIIYMLISYLALESIWSLGTINWGSSIRHHLPSYGILLIMSFYQKNSIFKPSKENN